MCACVDAVAGRQSVMRQYHVQFFGDEGERGWVGENAVMPYEGRTAFQQLCARMLARDRKNEKLYSVPSRRLRPWTVAVDYAEDAYPMNRAERVRNFAFVYEEAASSPVPTGETAAAAATGEKGK